MVKRKQTKAPAEIPEGPITTVAGAIAAINEKINTTSPLSMERLTKTLGLSQEIADAAFAAIIEKKKVIVSESGCLLKKGPRQHQGVVQITKSGAAFLLMGEEAEDIHLGGGSQMLPGDEVVVEVPKTVRAVKAQSKNFPSELYDSDWDQKPIVRMLVRRPMKEFIAKVRGIRRKQAELAADDARIKADFYLSEEDTTKVAKGDVLVVRPASFSLLGIRNRAEVLEVLGKEDDAGMEIDIAVRKFHIPHRFSEATERELEGFSDVVEKKDTKRRVDLRDIPFVTIDGADARDFDDAVYCQKMPRGRWRLLVAIADVSHYVVPGTALDKDAQERATSVYFPRKVIPMLPEKLSNGLCSLNPNVDRCTMVCDAVIDAKGIVKAYQFYPALIRSAARLIYDDVWEALQNPEGPMAISMGSVFEGVQSLHALFKVLLASRELRGAMDFETVETYIVADEEGKIQQILPRERNDAHRLIEEMMLVANTCAADFIARSKATSLYRVHEPPSEERIVKLRAMLAPLGLRLGGGDEPTPSDYCKLLREIETRPDKNMLQMALLRSMQQAFYSPVNAGHFGLSYPAYTHFTSPIRRYPDLLVHRTIRAILTGQTYHPKMQAELNLADTSFAVRKAEEGEALKKGPDFDTWEKLGLLCSSCERRADEASYDVMAWLKCYYMQSHVGGVYTGTVSGITGFALFVTLNELYVEGSVHISELGHDYFVFDDVNNTLVGRSTGKTFKVGDEVTVRVARCDLELRRIEFVLVATPADNPKKLARRTRRTKA